MYASQTRVFFIYNYVSGEILKDCILLQMIQIITACSLQGHNQGSKTRFTIQLNLVYHGKILVSSKCNIPIYFSFLD